MTSEFPRAGGSVAASRRPLLLRLLAGLCLVFTVVTADAAEAKTNEPARVKVSGFGFLGNREMVRLLRNFQPEATFPAVLTRTFIEDAALVLFSRAKSDGYLNAMLEAEFTLSDGTAQGLLWTNALGVQLPQAFAASGVHFRMRKGVRFYYQTITIVGAEAIPEKDARGYFISRDTLFRLRNNRVFTPELLKSSMSALEESLIRLGYRDAVVSTNRVVRDEASGAVTVELRVNEGIPTLVRSVAVSVEGPEDTAVTNQWVLRPNEPFSELWQQNLVRELVEQQYGRGFPDATVEFTPAGGETNEVDIQLDLAARVMTGPRIRVGEVRFSGIERTRPSVLEGRMTVESGEWLNRLEAEESRQRLARLGIFESTRLRYEEVDAETRSLLYELKESKPLSLSLLAGFGSYELLRGGVELEHRNVLGLAHNIRLRGVQSFKSTSGDFQYTVPEVLGENMDAFLKASALRREEVTFTREEYGGAVGIQKHVEAIRTDVSAHYDYEFLNAVDSEAVSTNALGLSDARSAALVLDLTHDRRETPLLPRRGWKVFGKFEAAFEALGGNVDYQRIIVGGSYHLDLHGGRLLHLGVTHGMSFTLGGTPEDLPFNKRFFPGGENSVRGYQQGEASPLDADGNQLGAETYTQGNLELEQLLTKSWSLVAFFDAVGFAENRADYPWTEGLYSVGGGIRWRSIIGPVRLEYGYNLNPRPVDPVGTLHFSIGFPF